MLPKFPQFKKLELSDQNDIEKITSRHLPYSDFDFPTMWSWDTDNLAMVSEANGNLVAMLYDHNSNEHFYTYLGNKDTNKTLKQLFAFSISKDQVRPELKLVPELSINNIDFTKYFIEIDLNNYDYIYGLKLLSTYPGIKFSDKRRKVNTFLKNNPSHDIRILDLEDPQTIKEIIEISTKWTTEKLQKKEDVYVRKELLAIKRFFESKFKDVVCTGIHIDNQLIAYSVYTTLKNRYAICHFTKGLPSYNGVYEYIIKESSGILLEKGCEFLNYQEDLGLDGLRFWKNSLNPTGFLRKYTVKEL